MDNETAKYILNIFSNLLTGAERMAIKHMRSIYKLGHSTTDNTNLTKVCREEGCLTSDQKVLDLLKDGYDKFEVNVANRIIAQHKDKVFFNRCPKCNKLARTPYASQCRHCGHSWHDLTVGKFLLKSSFQLTGRHFFLLGQTISGEIKQGNYMDLTILGLNLKPTIETIEFTFQKKRRKLRKKLRLGHMN